MLVACPVFASDRIRLAVLDITAAGLPAYYAGAVRDRIEVALYKSEKIDLLERDKVQLVLKEQNLAATACRDEGCAVRLGRFLSATHVIVGSVTRLDGYTVTVRVVDVARGKIVYADAEKTLKRDDLTGASASLAARVIARLEKITLEKSTAVSRPFNLSLSVGPVLPQGDLTAIAGLGWSVSFTGTIENVYMDNLFLGIKTGYYRLSGKDDVGSISLLPLTGMVGYKISLSNTFFFAPALSAGTVWIYKRNYAVNNSAFEPYIEPGFSVNLVLNRSIRINAGLHCSTVVERSCLVSFISFALGVSFLVGHY